ncbi:hypothetical protein ABR737_01655 [Streptomyces sp. Edi2]|uniref:hypothetical protein n=1 Tax=Streptomyces sp. Edi2 TaxID=3162528 RepID=UPI00330686D2
MEKLPFGITIHRVFEDGVVEDLACPKGHEMRLAVGFVERVIAKGHWVVIVPEGWSGVVAEVSFPIGSGLLSEIVFKALSAGQGAVVLPEDVERGKVLPVLRSLSGDRS